ncbi:hypothetical protein JL721_6334 [Aureococcus anophagefferens]|nr:hypothetical protein JL721_6334 [Aureococcus anophagefferens]
MLYYDAVARCAGSDVEAAALAWRADCLRAIETRRSDECERCLRSYQRAMGRSVGGGALDAQAGARAKRGHVFAEGADALEAKLVGTLGQRAGVAQRDAWREHAAAELRRARNLRADGDGASVAATVAYCGRLAAAGAHNDRSSLPATLAVARDAADASKRGWAAAEAAADATALDAAWLARCRCFRVLARVAAADGRAVSEVDYDAADDAHRPTWLRDVRSKLLAESGRSAAPADGAIAAAVRATSRPSRPGSPTRRPAAATASGTGPSSRRSASSTCCAASRSGWSKRSKAGGSRWTSRRTPASPRARAVRDAAKRAALEAAWKDAKRLARRRSPLVAAACGLVRGAAALLDAVDAAADAVDVEDALRTYDLDACGDCVAVVDETHALNGAPYAARGEDAVCCDGEAEALLWKAGEAERRGDDFSYFAFSSLAKELGVESPELRARFAARRCETDGGAAALPGAAGRLARLCGVRGAGGPGPSRDGAPLVLDEGADALAIREKHADAKKNLAAFAAAAASNDDDGGFDAALDVSSGVKSQAYELPRNCRDYAAALLFCADHADRCKALAAASADPARTAHALYRAFAAFAAGAPLAGSHVYNVLATAPELGVSREAEAPCFLRLCREGLFLEKKDGRFQSGRWLLHAPLDALALRLDGAGHWRLRGRPSRATPRRGGVGPAPKRGATRARAPRTCWRGSRATRCSAATSPGARRLRRRVPFLPPAPKMPVAVSLAKREDEAKVEAKVEAKPPPPPEKEEEAPEEVVAKDDDDDDDEPEIAPLKETPFDSAVVGVPHAASGLGFDVPLFHGRRRRRY